MSHHYRPRDTPPPNEKKNPLHIPFHLSQIPPVADHKKSGLKVIIPEYPTATDITRQDQGPISSFPLNTPFIGESSTM